jgi:hypothetical protein
MFKFFSKESRNLRNEQAIALQEQKHISEMEKQQQARAEFFKVLIDQASTFSFVKFNGNNLSVSHTDAFEAKLAKKELMVLKKLAQIQKRNITDQYKNIRNDYNQSVGNRSSLALLTGTGKFGTIVRAGVRVGRATERANMANITQTKNQAIAPWENIIDIFTSAIVKIDASIIKYQVQ